MKRTAFAILIIYGSGCATAGLNCDETCATYGMACTGITSGQYQGTGWGHGGPVSVNGDTHGVSCRKPASESETAAISSLAATANEKERGAKRKNALGWIVGIGGLLMLGVATSKSSGPSAASGY